MNNCMLAFLGWAEVFVIFLVLAVMAGLAIAAALLLVWLLRRHEGESKAAAPAAAQAQPAEASAKTCPRCGTALPATSPQGLCPRCVMGVGLTTRTEAPGELGSHGTKVVKPTPSPEEIAKHFPQLEIMECLGRGGMGVVYKARQPKLNRMVALKILAPEKGADPKFAERFQREALALARLSHPNIVTVHDFGEAEGMFYLLMEFVDGVSLRQTMREGRMKPEEALVIVPKICEALQFAHEQGVVHRDIKPENVLLDKQGRVKIADFGIAKIVADAGESPFVAPPSGGPDRLKPELQTLTQDQVLGTPLYMAPEQVEKPQLVDHRADIYSLGVVFYEMLTGELPLGKFQPPSKKVQVDVRLDEVVLHALEKEPERRYQHASEVKTDLETIAGTGTEGATSHAPKTEPRFFDFTIGMPQFVQRDGQARCYWPGILLLFSTIGFAVCGFNLASGLIIWLLDLKLPPVISFINLGDLWLWLVWLVISAIGRLAALNLGAEKIGRASLTASKSVNVVLILLVAAAWAFGLGHLAWWLRRTSTTLQADSGFRLFLGIALLILVGAFLIRGVWRAVNKPLAPGAPVEVEPESARPPLSPARKRGLWLSLVVLLVVGLVALIAWSVRRQNADRLWEQRSYVQQKLMIDIESRLGELGYNQTWSRTTLSDDLSKAWRESGPMTRRQTGGDPEAITNAAVSLHYLGNGRWLALGSGQLSEVRFEINTLAEMARGPRPVPPPPPSKPFDDLGLPFPRLNVIAGWNGETHALAEPVSAEEAWKQTKEYAAWEKVRNVRSFTFTNACGYTFEIQALMMGQLDQRPRPLLGETKIRRPDGVLLASAPGANGVNPHWDINVMDEAGNNVTAKVSVERAAPAEPLRVAEVRWHPDMAEERIWSVNRFGVAYAEATVSPDGARKIVRLVEELKDAPYAQMPTADGTNAGFGPTHEIVLHAAADWTDCFLDMHTGRVLSAPPELQDKLQNSRPMDEKLRSIKEWLRDNGVELVAQPGEHMRFIDGNVCALDASGGNVFDRQTPQSVLDLTQRFRPQSGAITFPPIHGREGPASKETGTCFFCRRREMAGVIEILDHDRNANVWRLRYKLVQSVSANPEKPAVHATPELEAGSSSSNASKVLPNRDPYKKQRLLAESMKSLKLDRSYVPGEKIELMLATNEAARLEFMNNAAGVSEFLFHFDAENLDVFYNCDGEDHDWTVLTSKRAADSRKIAKAGAPVWMDCSTTWKLEGGKAHVTFVARLLSTEEMRQLKEENVRLNQQRMESLRHVLEWNDDQTAAPIRTFIPTQDDSNLTALRTKYKLEKVVAGAADDYEQLRQLVKWVHDRWQQVGDNTPSKPDPLTVLDEAAQGRQFRCVEYATVVTGCAQTLGLPARVLALKRNDVETAQSGAGHLVAEVWLKSRNKWVFADGQWDAIPEKDGVPLNAVEFQDAFAHNELGLTIRSMSNTDRDAYLRWVLPYLYYFDFNLNQDLFGTSSSPAEKGRSDSARGSIMLVPKGAKNPTVFQRTTPIKNCTYISSPRAFYAVPTPSP